MWHAGMAKRGLDEITTCVGRFLKGRAVVVVNHCFTSLFGTKGLLKDRAESSAKEVVFYSDNCAEQNKNHNVAAMYALIVATTGVDVITHQFLEKGHTQNEGDSMHSTIEIVRAPIYTPLQYYFIARSAKKTGKAYHVYKMETEEFGALAKDYFKNTRKTAETGNRTPDSGVKGSGANHYPRAPALSKKRHS